MNFIHFLVNSLEKEQSEVFESRVVLPKAVEQKGETQEKKTRTY